MEDQELEALRAKRIAEMQSKAVSTSVDFILCCRHRLFLFHGTRVFEILLAIITDEITF